MIHIVAKDLGVQRAGRPILSHIDLSLSAGQIVTLMGPNGSGKTTLLRALLGLCPIQTGSVFRAPQLRIGYMPQHIKLDATGKPQVAIGEFRIPCESPCLIESKSFKLYLNSLNHSVFPDLRTLQNTLAHDLSAATQAPVSVLLTPLHAFQDHLHSHFPGQSIDSALLPDEGFTGLRANPDRIVRETLASDLLKSNCPVTGQPDWGSIQIQYHGPQLDRAQLLAYLVDFRGHQAFHEHCVETIFMDLLNHCQPQRLTVYARYTRRGGLDINPYRSTNPQIQVNNIRLARQ